MFRRSKHFQRKKKDVKFCNKFYIRQHVYMFIFRGGGALGVYFSFGTKASGHLYPLSNNCRKWTCSNDFPAILKLGTPGEFSHKEKFKKMFPCCCFLYKISILTIILNNIPYGTILANLIISLVMEDFLIYNL